MSKAEKQSPEAQVELAQQVIGIIRSEYSGPLPPPQSLEKYNKIIPGSAERILAMAEKQSDHRRELEKKALNTDSRNSLLGIISAFIITMTALGAGTYVTKIGHAWPGTLLGSLGLVGLASVFVYGTRQRRKERETKAAAYK